MIKLRTATWKLEFFKTLTREDGREVDMYLLLNHEETPEDIISLSVPVGRQDIAEFVARSVMAGQRVIQGLPLGHPQIKDEQPGFEQQDD